MLQKLMGGALVAKATALPGVLIVASVLLTSSAPSAPTELTTLESLPAPTVAVPSTPSVRRTEAPEPTRPPVPQPAIAPSSPTCDAEARDAARQIIRAAFAKSDAALDQLRTERPAARSVETIARADAMLTGIADAADRAASEMCAAAAEIAQRAVSAMEITVDLARSATTATPTPRPTPRPKRGRDAPRDR